MRTATNVRKMATADSVLSFAHYLVDYYASDLQEFRVLFTAGACSYEWRDQKPLIIWRPTSGLMVLLHEIGHHRLKHRCNERRELLEEAEAWLWAERRAKIHGVRFDYTEIAKIFRPLTSRLPGGSVKRKYPDNNPKSVFGVRKVPIGVVPPASIIYEALAMEEGRNKYGLYNWRGNKVAAMVYIDSAFRHLLAYLDGEDLCPKSGKPHLGHAKACLGILADATESGNLIDDRPVPGPASRLLERWTRKKGRKNG